MSEDPETARHIGELAAEARPLLVLDVDEVIIEFVSAFVRFVDRRGVNLRFASFRLHENAIDRKMGRPLEKEQLAAMLDAFFEAQAEWQTVADGAADTIATIAAGAEIVMLRTDIAPSGAGISAGWAFPIRCSPPKRQRVRRSGSFAVRRSGRWPSSTTSGQSDINARRCRRGASLPSDGHPIPTHAAASAHRRNGRGR